MTPLYLAQKAAIDRQREKWEATLHGFIASEYAETPPPHWYAYQPDLRQAFEAGHARGRALLQPNQQEGS